jgi:multiple sugar transport system substrate-binding protein
MKQMLSNYKCAALAASWLTLTGVGGMQQAQADALVFLSTQLLPIDEAQKMRDILLKGGPQATFTVAEPSAFSARVKADLGARKRTISLVGALHGELRPLAALGALDPIDDVAERVKANGIPESLMELGKFGGAKQRYIPWLQATYVMVINREALSFLPAGVDPNTLTYDELSRWANAITEKTGQRRLGFPAGPKGLFARFLQGYLYPSYTGSTVSEFRSSAAEKMWIDFKGLWQSVNPNSTNYNFMQDPLQAGEVWIAWDHISRLKDALDASPGSYEVVAPPAGPKGRSYMAAIVGLSIIDGAPDRAGASALIEHLLKPETQVLTAMETGFFPVVGAGLPTDVSPGLKLLTEGIGRTQSAKDAIPVLLPVGLGDRADEFNKVFTDTFQRVVLRGEPARAALDAEAGPLRDIINAARAPCWPPDKPSDGPCPVN